MFPQCGTHGVCTLKWALEVQLTLEPQGVGALTRPPRVRKSACNWVSPTYSGSLCICVSAAADSTHQEVCNLVRFTTENNPERFKPVLFRGFTVLVIWKCIFFYRYYSKVYQTHTCTYVHIWKYTSLHGSQPRPGKGACVTQWSYAPCHAGPPKTDGQPDAKSRLIRKDPDAGKDWGREEKRATEDDMVGWHHWLDGHEFEQVLGDSEGHRTLAVYQATKSQTRLGNGTTAKRYICMTCICE